VSLAFVCYFNAKSRVLAIQVGMENTLEQQVAKVAVKYIMKRH